MVEAWFVFSFLATFIWSLLQVTGKYILTRYFKNPLPNLFVSGWIALVLSSIILYFNFKFLSLADILFASFAGASYILGVYFLWRSFLVEEVSRVVILLSLSPVFITILSFVLLGDILSPIKYAGVAMIVLGSILVSFKKGLKMGSAFRLMLLSALFFSFNALMIDYLVRTIDFWVVFSYANVAGAFTAIILGTFYLNKAVQIVRKSPLKILSILTVLVALDLTALFFYTTALNSGFVALVTAVNATGSFMVLILATLLNFSFPSIFKEKISTKIILTKVIAIVLTIIGVLLIQ